MDLPEKFALRVVERDHAIVRSDQTGQRQLPVKATRDFTVDRQVIREHSNLLSKYPLLNIRASIVTIDDHSIPAVELWVERLHDRTVDLSNYTISHWWHAVAFGLSFVKKVEVMADWFEDWLSSGFSAEHDEPSTYQKLVPAFFFHCLKVFAEITKKQVYTDVKALIRNAPEGAEHLHNRVDQPIRLSGDILDDLRGAHGSTRRDIAALWHDLPHRINHYHGLHGATRGDLPAWWHDLPEEVKFNCNDRACSLTGEFLYFYSLKETHIWPIDRKPASLNHLLDELLRFRYITAGVDTGNKQLCAKHKTGAHVRAVERTMSSLVESCRHLFQGLCLDCMNFSRLDSFDADYWTHCVDGRYAAALAMRTCNWRHNERTWYFSFLARPTIYHRVEEARKKLKEEELKEEHQQLHSLALLGLTDPTKAEAW